MGGERSETEGGISAMVPLSIQDALSLLAVIEVFYVHHIIAPYSLG